MNNRKQHILTVLILLIGAATPTFAQTINGNIYGGGEISLVEGDTHVEVNTGKVGKPAGDPEAFNGGVFGGGLGQTTVVTGNVEVLIGKDGSAPDAEGPTINGDVYGGSALGNTNCTIADPKDATADKTTSVTLNAGAINGSMYGGALGQRMDVKGATSDIAANVYGPVKVTVNGGSVFTTDGTGANGSGGVFGCNNLNGEPKSTVKVDVYGTNSHDNNETDDNHDDDKYAVFSVYGGGNQADYTIGTPIVTVHNCENSIQYVYGGGNAAHLTNGNTDVTIYGGNRIGNVFGGGNGQVQAANISGGTDVKVYGGSIGNVFGGSNSQGTIGGGITVEINQKTEDGHSECTTLADNVFGGGQRANYTGNPVVNVLGGTVLQNVYGGGALANVDGYTTVNLLGGTVGGAYGGGLGRLDDHETPEDEAVAALVTGNATVTLNGSAVNGDGIFGGNNLNGTPKGHIFVHVLKTVSAGNGAAYHVPAVYGGGNLSAYEPDDDKDYAEVLIEGCANSIDYVYGGGNAAPVPATSVIIYGANAINNAFAGGNGAGQSSDSSAPNYNPGADVGYKGYYSKGSREEYGTGETDIKIYGGTINNVYGGSNTLGYIRTHAYVEVLNVPDDHKGTVCELHLGEVHAGGNQAEMNCGGSVTLACSEGAEVIYAGSSNADIHGNIDLVITSGTFGKIFGGNNHSGNVYGNIKIDIDETGCWPIMIGELYACGNEAAYSVYGYNNDGSCKTSGNKEYSDPVINLISFTRIGKVFGGGYAAAVYGDPIINVDPIKGKYAGRTVGPVYVLNENDERITSDGSSTLPYGITWSSSNIVVIPDEVGSIGTIYGGGNKGAVYGDTHVNIGLNTTNKHLNADPASEGEEVAVTITGDVFGGGNEAIVSGDTNVKIGK